MAKSKSKPVKSSSGKGFATAAGVAGLALAAGGAVLALRRSAQSTPEADLGPATDTPSGSPVGEPLYYTGSQTPDMAVSYVPGIDQDDARVAGTPLGGESGEAGTAEQRDAFAGVQA